MGRLVGAAAVMPIRVAKTLPGFLAHLLVALVFTGATIGFLIWRRDMPPDNPGGPIGGMGGWYVFWNWIAIGPGPLLAVWGWFSVLLFLWGKIKERVGEPPPAPEEQAAGSPFQNGIAAVICLTLVGGIAAHIATHPAHIAKQARARDACHDSRSARRGLAVAALAPPKARGLNGGIYAHHDP